MCSELLIGSGMGWNFKWKGSFGLINKFRIIVSLSVASEKLSLHVPPFLAFLPINMLIQGYSFTQHGLLNNGYVGLPLYKKEQKFEVTGFDIILFRGTKELFRDGG